MSDHYCCKQCGLRYDDCRCKPVAAPRGDEAMAVINQGRVTPAKMASDSFDSPTPNDQLESLLDGGFIQRYHVKGRRMLVPQNVAEHSWRMAAALFHIDPNARAAMVWATLFHDVSERMTGDVPSPVKRDDMVRVALNRISTTEEYRLGIRFDLTEEEVKLLTWLDRYEGALHCLDEAEMGNRKAMRTMIRYFDSCTGHEHRLLDSGPEKRRAALCVQLTEKVNYYLGEKE